MPPRPMRHLQPPHRIPRRHHFDVRRDRLRLDPNRLLDRLDPRARQRREHDDPPVLDMHPESLRSRAQILVGPQIRQAVAQTGHQIESPPEPNRPQITPPKIHPVPPPSVVDHLPLQINPNRPGPELIPKRRQMPPRPTPKIQNPRRHPTVLPHQLHHRRHDTVITHHRVVQVRPPIRKIRPRQQTPLVAVHHHTHPTPRRPPCHSPTRRRLRGPCRRQPIAGDTESTVGSMLVTLATVASVARPWSGGRADLRHSATRC